MINTDIINVLYIVAAILFIFGLKMLSHQETAKKGNMISAFGMLIAIISALVSHNVLQWQWVLVGIVTGAVVGAFASRTVAMTAMPEMVALFNGFGGTASLLVGWAEYQKGNPTIHI